MTPDEYPCLNEGTIKMGRRWYCDDHAEDVEADAEYVESMDFEGKDYYAC